MPRHIMSVIRTAANKLCCLTVSLTWDILTNPYAYGFALPKQSPDGVGARQTIRSLAVTLWHTALSVLSVGASLKH